jgi:hypothetical protein
MIPVVIIELDELPVQLAYLERCLLEEFLQMRPIQQDPYNPTILTQPIPNNNMTHNHKP